MKIARITLIKSVFQHIGLRLEERKFSEQENSRNISDFRVRLKSKDIINLKCILILIKNIRKQHGF